MSEWDKRTVGSKDNERMKDFLQFVAEDMVTKLGHDLSRVAVVFPNKRASLFFNEYLAKAVGRPLWSPTYITISELFRKHARLEVADSIKLVAELHRTFAECTGSSETLDHFYGWGQLLLADFDDIDKNMADAEKVLANVTDLHEMDDLSYLTAEQRELLKHFFSCFTNDTPTEIKRRFLNLWCHFSDIYHRFNEHLAAQGLAYEGALYRMVANDDTVEFDYGTYVFVGFNMIQKVEQRLFSRLKQQQRAMFYWDFDRYYMPTKGGTDVFHEAGHYIASYLADFPNELDTNRNDIYNNFDNPQKEVSLIAATTEDIQARYITQWLREKGRISSGRRTAIVLCNEKLLPTVIHCLPNEVSKVNITTGYPMAVSPLTSLVSLLFALQTDGYMARHKRFRLNFVNRLLEHPYIVYIIDNYRDLFNQINIIAKVYYPTASQLAIDGGAAIVFEELGSTGKAPSPTDITAWLLRVLRLIASHMTTHHDPFLQEAIFRVYTIVNRLNALMTSGELDISCSTLQRLLLQLIRETSVPFHGEPVVGLQIMGVLETRNLDFEHLLILSCNEGNMPKGVNDTSFIPYSVRKAHDLTTIDNKVAIYAYYFHRLIQRASDVTIVYNRSSEDGKTGELSRFALQLMVESHLRIKRKVLQGGQKPVTWDISPINKNSHIMDLLVRRFTKSNAELDTSAPLLSPTAINSYLRCGIQFFHNYVLGVREPDEADGDTMDQRAFGNIFHEASQLVYEPLLRHSSHIGKAALARLLSSKVEIEAAVDSAFRKVLFNVFGDRGFAPEYNGLQLINREVIVTYLRRLLEIDMKLAPFEILGLETDVREELEVKFGERKIKTMIGGRIDRLDLVTDHGVRRIRVIDYKTGSHHDKKGIPNIKEIFSSENRSQQAGYYLQTILYSHIVRNGQHNAANDAVSPALLFIQHTAGDDYDPTLCIDRQRVTDVAGCEKEFMEALKDVVNNIFNPDIPFSPAADKASCAYCPYRRFCGLG